MKTQIKKNIDKCKMLEKNLSIENEYSHRELLMNYYTKGMSGMITSKGFVIGIICAKDTELHGVRDAISQKFNIKFVQELDKAENYRRVLIAEIRQDNLDHRVILTQCDQGNTGAAIAYDSLSHYKPDYVLFCGIAGTCDEKVNIGDVFIPFEILSAELKKEVNDEFKIRGTSYKIQSNHIGLLKMFIENSKYEFSLTCDKAVSDNTVYATDDSEILRKVLAFNDQVSCIEMESAGLHNADYSRNKTRYGVYSIRGISDRANSIKNDNYHKIAIKNASIVISDLIGFFIEKIHTIRSIKK